MIIVIKDMKMPTNCRTCPLLYVPSICDGSKHCPLIPVPPHGRLIDADACESYFYEHLSDAGMAGAMNAISEMPTIIPADY